MKKTKKAFAVLLSLLMLLALCPAQVAPLRAKADGGYAMPNTFTFEPSMFSGGDTICISLFANDSIGLADVGITMHYDPAVLSLDEWTIGEDAEQINYTKSNGFYADCNTETAGEIYMGFYFKGCLTDAETAAADAKAGAEVNINDVKFQMLDFWFTIIDPDAATAEITAVVNHCRPIEMSIEPASIPLKFDFYGPDEPDDPYDPDEPSDPDDPDVPSILGDMDGDGWISSADARFVLRGAIELEEITDEQLLLGDLDKDGSLTAADARYAMRVAVGLEDSDVPGIYLADPILDPADAYIGLKVLDYNDGTLQVLLTIENGMCFESADFAIVYDPAMLANPKEICSTDEMEALRSEGLFYSIVENNSEEGVIHVGCCSQEAILSSAYYEKCYALDIDADSFPLATISFDVIGEGEDIYLSTLIKNSTGVALGSMIDVNVMEPTPDDTQPEDTFIMKEEWDGSGRLGITVASAGVGLTSATLALTYDADLLSYANDWDTDDALALREDDASVYLCAVNGETPGEVRISLAFSNMQETDTFDCVTLWFDVLGEPREVTNLSLEAIEANGVDMRGSEKKIMLIGDPPTAMGSVEMEAVSADGLFGITFYSPCPGLTFSDWTITYDSAVLSYVGYEDTADVTALNSGEFTEFSYDVNGETAGEIKTSFFFRNEQTADRFALFTLWFDVMDVEVNSTTVYVQVETCGGATLLSISNDFNVPADLGDIDGDGWLSGADARMALRGAVGLEDLGDGLNLLDMNRDGSLAAVDGRLILRAAVGLESFETPGVYLAEPVPVSTESFVFVDPQPFDGEELTLDVAVRNGEGLQSLDFALEYDADLLSLENVEKKRSLNDLVDKGLVWDACNTGEEGLVQMSIAFRDSLLLSEEYINLYDSYTNSFSLYEITFNFIDEIRNSTVSTLVKQSTGAEIGSRIDGKVIVVVGDETEPTDVPEEPTDVPEEPTDVPEEPTDVPEEPTSEPEAPETVLHGDIDGDGWISCVDARMALRAAVGLEDLGDGFDLLDMDGDGKLTASDARLLTRAAVGLELLDVPGIYLADSVIASSGGYIDVYLSSQKDDTLTVCLAVVNGEGLQSADFSLTYDADVLTFKSVSSGADFSALADVTNVMTACNPNESGVIHLGFLLRDALRSAAEYKDAFNINVNTDNFTFARIEFELTGTPGDSLVMSTLVKKAAGADLNSLLDKTVLVFEDEEPTEVPTEAPTKAPVDEPTEAPTEVPTEVPVEEPTEVPVEEPTEVPVEEPTEVPVEEPTEEPEEPTEVPVEEPTEAPTEVPTETPVEEPTETPVEKPTKAPIEEPTDLPEKPTEKPEEKPVPIDTENAKELNGNVFIRQGMEKDALLSLAGKGARLVNEDGSALAKGQKLGSGMTLIRADGSEQTVVIKGDNDGDGEISATDARFALRTSVRLERPKDWQLEASRVGGSTGDLSAADARGILRASVRLDVLALV